MRKSRLSLALQHALPLSAAMGLGLLAMMPVQAQDAADTAPAADAIDVKSLDKVMVLGSRRQGTSETETLVPVDVISMTKAATQGAQFDLAQVFVERAGEVGEARHILGFEGEVVLGKLGHYAQDIA